MKKIYVMALAALMMMAIPAKAQVSATESGIVYCMPYTQICIDVEYEELTLEKGPFYQYSERYLATKNVVTEDGVRYQISNITLRAKTTADRSRTYTLVADSKKVVLTKEGLLYGIGVDMPQEKPAADKPKTVRLPKESAIQNPFAGLLEEQMLASSISKMAEGVAKQIYHIREARINWLCGDVDHMPADGQSLQMILQQLDNQEKQLTSLFLGNEKRRTLHKYIYLDPKDMQDQVVFRFSAQSGVLDADDLSGEPYYLTAETEKAEYTNTNKKQKTPSPSALYYNLPGAVRLTLTDGTRTLQETRFPVAQLGISVALPASTFNNAGAILLNTKSGALICVE